MRPSEILALPEIRRIGIDDLHGRTIRRIFGIDLHDEVEAAEGDPELVSVVRLACVVGGQWCTISSVEFDGRLVGIHSVGGERDHDEFYVADRGAHRAAFEYLRSKIPMLDLEVVDVAQDDDLPEMTSFYGASTMEVDGAVRLVQDGDVGAHGELVFDKLVYDAAFDEIVRPAFPGLSREDGFFDPRMRELATDAIIAGLRDGMRSQRIGAMIDFDGREDWVAAVAATGEGTYAFGISSRHVGGSHFTWARGRFTKRLGGPEMFDDFVAQHAPTAPTP